MAGFLAIVSIGVSPEAIAAPPTVTPSPGYDARLSEQRARAVEAQAPVIIRKPPLRRVIRRHRNPVMQ
jgi:hypothetical protein